MTGAELFERVRAYRWRTRCTVQDLADAAMISASSIDKLRRSGRDAGEYTERTLLAYMARHSNGPEEKRFTLRTGDRAEGGAAAVQRARQNSAMPARPCAAAIARAGGGRLGRATTGRAESVSLQPLSDTAGRAFSRAQTDDPVNRETHDFYPTHPGATRALLSVETFDGPIWEPACGDGAMSRVLETTGQSVISTDLIDRGHGEGGRDFLMEWAPRAPHIVTNPPFRWAREFADRALLLTRAPGGKVCLFLRLAFLEGQERQRWFATTPLASVWVMSRRVPMARGRHVKPDEMGGGVIAFAWFVWEHGHQGKPELGWLDWKSA